MNHNSKFAVLGGISAGFALGWGFGDQWSAFVMLMAFAYSAVGYAFTFKLDERSVKENEENNEE